MEPSKMEILAAKVSFLESSFEQFRTEVSRKLNMLERFLASKNDVNKKQLQNDQVMFDNFITNWKKSASAPQQFHRKIARDHQRQHNVRNEISNINESSNSNHSSNFAKRSEHNEHSSNRFQFNDPTPTSNLSSLSATNILQNMLKCYDESQSSESMDPLGFNSNLAGGRSLQQQQRRSVPSSLRIVNVTSCNDSERNKSRQEDQTKQRSTINDDTHNENETSNEALLNEFESESIKIEPDIFLDIDEEDNPRKRRKKSSDDDNSFEEDEADIDLTQDNDGDQDEEGSFHNFEASQFHLHEQPLPISIIHPGQRDRPLPPQRQTQTPTTPTVLNGKILCSLCHSYFHRNSLRRHMRLVHYTVPKLNAPGQSFRQPPTFMQQPEPEPESDEYQCDACPSVSFHSSALLVQHIISFHSRSPNGCESCDKVFVTYQNLKHHQAVSGHGTRFSEEPDGKRRVKCIYCPRSYQTRADLLVHMRSHTGEKPFKCDVCSRGFADHRNMKRHRVRCEEIANESRLLNNQSLFMEEGRSEDSFQMSSTGANDIPDLGEYRDNFLSDGQGEPEPHTINPPKNEQQGSPITFI